MSKNIRKIVVAALLAAMTTVATCIMIPCPVGYINLGDVAVLLAGWIAGPVYGFLAAAVGSAVTDVLLGYAAYAPASFVIKGLVALVAYFVHRKIRNMYGRVLSAFLGEAVMVAGYFVYESIALGMGMGAIAAVGFNSVQGTVALIAASLLFSAAEKNSYISKEAAVFRN